MKADINVHMLLNFNIHFEMRRVLLGHIDLYHHAMYFCFPGKKKVQELC